MIDVRAYSNTSKRFKSKKRVSDHGEVFTAEREVNAMLDMVNQEIERLNSRFLEPACGHGNFLAEILRRKLHVAAKQYAESQSEFERSAAIAISNLYGIDILEDNAKECRERLFQIFDEVYTALYKSNCKEASRRSINFILNSNILCGDALDFTNLLAKAPQFDVIIGNPPYHLNDAGYGRSAKPIYQDFIRQAKTINPKYLAMIIPARWFAGGKGLDDFRAEMLTDKRLRKLVDFENANNVFPGVDVAGGICYFLWDRDNPGLCEVVNMIDGEEFRSERSLDEFPVFIRHGRAIPIIRKVLASNDNGGKRLSEMVSSRKPFGLPTNYTPKKSGAPCWFVQKIGLKFADKAHISDENGYLNKWKLLIPPAPIAGQTDFSKPIAFYYDANTRIAKPGECCTESYIVAGAFDSEKEVISFKSYLFTKTVRFLLLQTVVSQHVTKEKFIFIPHLGQYEGIYTDEMLAKRWSIDKEEWAFIDSKIRTVDPLSTQF